MKKNLEQQIAEQRKWMERCGGTRAGYVKNYGSASDPNHSGDGGEAIFDADRARLIALLAQKVGYKR